MAKYYQIMTCRKYLKVGFFHFLASRLATCLGVDTNGDHVIDYDEFIILVTKKIILNAVENKYK